MLHNRFLCSNPTPRHTLACRHENCQRPSAAGNPRLRAEDGANYFHEVDGIMMTFCLKLNWQSSCQQLIRRHPIHNLTLRVLVILAKMGARAENWYVPGSNGRECHGYEALEYFSINYISEDDVPSLSGHWTSRFYTDGIGRRHSRSGVSFLYQAPRERDKPIFKTRAWRTSRSLCAQHGHKLWCGSPDRRPLLCIGSEPSTL